MDAEQSIDSEDVQQSPRVPDIKDKCYTGPMRNLVRSSMLFSVVFFHASTGFPLIIEGTALHVYEVTLLP